MSSREQLIKVRIEGTSFPKILCSSKLWTTLRNFASANFSNGGILLETFTRCFFAPVFL